MEKTKNCNLLVIDQNWESQKMDIPVKEVLLRSPHTNSDVVWFSYDTATIPGLSYDLLPGDFVEFPLDTLYRLNFNFINAADKLILIYGN
jgi:hypothetical protein